QVWSIAVTTATGQRPRAHRDHQYDAAEDHPEQTRHTLIVTDRGRSGNSIVRIRVCAYQIGIRCAQTGHANGVKTCNAEQLGRARTPVAVLPWLLLLHR